ncbi:hypothetical protein [Streptomyces sp. MZ04]|uniref:hypothetical protein n=1 Tax=Streptomyces sp. MZ04 TaxID=2559236 RepID=UPI0014328DEE|nr:hypothetical protein [Streptomyces sp. MZ04]
MTSHVEQQIAARIAAVKARRRRRREERQEFAENRAHGLQARHAAKVARWADEDADQ